VEAGLWRRHDISDPDENPFEAVYAAVFQGLGETKAKPFREPSRDVFSRLTSFLADEGISHPLFFVDPFEKVFARESEVAEKWREDFAASLVDFANQNFEGARLILGMRDDFLGSLSQFPELCRFTDANLVRVFPMDEDSLRLVVRRPAADHGTAIEDGIVQDIVDKVMGRNGMLPLMQDILRQLWADQEKTDLATTRTLKTNRYFALGGVLGSLTKRLDALCVEKGEECLRRIFLRTVQVASDQNTPTISRHGNRDELTEGDRAILDELIDKKVLTTFDAAPGQSQRAFGLPHEAVIQNWEKLKIWVNDSRHLLYLLGRLQVDVSERRRKLTEHPYQVQQINEELLWRGSRLEELSEIAESEFEQWGFTAEMKEFRDASLKLKRDQLTQEKIRAERQRGLLAIFGSVITLFAIIAGIFWIRAEAALTESNRRLDLTKLPEAQHALERSNLELAENLLDDVKETNRCIAWRHLKRSLDGSIFTLYGHTDAVSSVAISTDGERIVTGSWDGTARVWDARTGQPLRELKGHTESVTSVAISTDGERIVTGSGDCSAKVWDARTGQPLWQLKGHSSRVSSVAISTDGERIITGSWDCSAKVWDARTGQPLWEIKDHTGSITGVAISADGERIVTGSDDRKVKVWDARKRKSLLELTGHTKPVTSVAISPDGARIVTGSEDGTARVWDGRTGQSLLELNGHAASVTGVAISADGQRIVGSVVISGAERFLSGSPDSTARVWNAWTGELVLELKGHTHAVTSVAVSTDSGRIVTGSRDCSAKVWDARSGLPVLAVTGHTESVTSIAISTDGERVVTGSQDSTARVWDARTGQSLLPPMGHEKPVTSVAISADGARIVTGSQDSIASMWDARTGELLRELKGHTDYVTSVAISRDSQRIVTGSRDCTARVWDTRTGHSISELKGHTYSVSSAAISTDGERIITGSRDRSARVWDARTGQSLLELKGHTDFVTSVAISGDNKWIVTGSWDRSAKLWDARTGQSLSELKGHTDSVTSVAISRDSQRIVTGSWDRSARVWDARTGQPLPELKGHTGSVTSVAISADSQRIVTGSQDSTARLWDARTGQSLFELTGHTKPINSVVISADSERIVTGSWDGTARAWDPRTGQSLFELKGDTRPVISVAISADCQRIVTGSLDGKATVWDARTGSGPINEPIPELQSTSRLSPDRQWWAHIRFRKVVLVPWELSEEQQEIRRWLTCPRPDLHKMQSEQLQKNAESLRNLNNLPAATGADFGAQVHLALEQQALGQQLVDDHKPELAAPYFAKAKELWPKPVPVEIVPRPAE
jgi:WD40 repeat protein